MESKNKYKALGLALNKYGKYVVQQSKSNLTKSKPYSKGGGTLYNSIKYGLQKSNQIGKPYVLDFLMADYGPFVDKGVAGVNSTYPETRAAMSPFKYGTGTGPKGGLTRGIQSWLEKKKFRWRDELGRYISYKSMRYLIVKKIYFQGIKASLFFTKPFEAGLNKYAIDIVQGYEKDIETEFKK